MHFHREFKSWIKVENDMRAAGYSEAQIQKAKESYLQCLSLLDRALQRILKRAEALENETSDPSVNV